MTIKPKNEYREPRTETVYIKQEIDDSNFNENSNNFLPLPDPNFIQVNEHFVDQKNSNRLVSLLFQNFTTRCIDVPDFFFRGGSSRPPRISKFFFRGGPGGRQGVNWILGWRGPLGGRFKGSRGSVHGILRFFLFIFFNCLTRHMIHQNAQNFVLVDLVN